MNAEACRLDNIQNSIAAKSGSTRELSLSQIGTRLGFALGAEFMRQFGFEAAGRDCAGVLCSEHEFSKIYTALINHIGQVQLHFRTYAIIHWKPVGNLSKK